MTNRRASRVGEQTDTAAQMDLGVEVTSLAEIAKEHLRIDTLETRRSDSLDFHDVSVWGVRAALEAAFRAGAAAAKRRDR